MLKLNTKKKCNVKTVKTAIFGIASSGKTTVLKQLDLFYNDGKNLKVISNNNIINNIRQNCIDNIISLCRIVKDEKCIQILKSYSINTATDLHLISVLISSIWKRPLIKMKYTERHWYSISGYKLDDNMEIFFDRIDKIMQIKYMPTCDDVIQYKTVHSNNINVKISTNINAYNITECRKFKSISCKLIIFCASLSDYCVYNESTKRQSMHDSLQLFGKIVNSNMGKNSRMVLLFNKIDIFKQCLRKGLSLRHCFGNEWTGHDYTLQFLHIWARRLAMNFERNIKHIIPDEVVDIIQKYLSVDITMRDEEYFDLCYKEAADFVKQKYLNRLKLKNINKNVYSQLFNAINYDAIEDVICNYAVYGL
eukprot:152849_1